VQKQAVSAVCTQDREGGHYSLYFLVPKKTGEFRPVLDLRSLNLHIARRKFRMLTIKQLLGLLQPGDWFTTIDLRDAYFHVEIAPKHRKYLCFALQGVACEYNRLPFSYSLSPRTFSECVATALQPLRGRGMRVFFYLDDLIVMARSRERAMFYTVHLILHLTKLGLVINWKKSTAIPHQQARIWEWCSMQARCTPPCQRETHGTAVCVLRGWGNWKGSVQETPGRLALRVHCTCLRTGGESLPHGGPCTLNTSHGCVNSLI